MKNIIFFFLFSGAIIFLSACGHSQAESSGLITTLAKPVDSVVTTNNSYCWLADYDAKTSIANRISVPSGYKRIPVRKGSFADWLRFLPLKPGNPDVRLFNGQLKNYQGGHAAVLNVDVGSTDLQQCADAVMRMRAEYLYSTKNYEDLHFNFTSGHTVGFKKWSEGNRTVIKGNHVTWSKSASKDDSYKTFKGYLNVIFNYAGTSSLSKELKPVKLKDIQPGDVFIFGGFPGHAVLVVDVCENPKTGDKLFLIQQSYMPAQEIHILKNFNDAAITPWYNINFEGDLKTPEWTFTKDQLMRF